MRCFHFECKCFYVLYILFEYDLCSCLKMGLYFFYFLSRKIHFFHTEKTHFLNIFLAKWLPIITTHFFALENLIKNVQYFEWQAFDRWKKCWKYDMSAKCVFINGSKINDLTVAKKRVGNWNKHKQKSPLSGKGLQYSQ